MSTAYLTESLPGIGGQIKQLLEDFRVEELPLYAPQGTGTHGYMLIEKRGISTLEAVKQIARGLGKKNFDIGYAGLKDARAVARQWFSVEHEDSARLRSLEIPHAKVIEVTRHRNKIKIGHLAGNRFIIKVRNKEWEKAGVSLDDARGKAEAILEALGQSGVPNFFGPQRFGMRKDNHLLGMALVKGDHQRFLNRFLGDPDATVDQGDVLLARQHYAKGKIDLALQHWPGHLQQERRALSALLGGNARRAVMSVDLSLKRLLVSALQAHLFNQVLERRLSRLTTMLPGDLAWKHDNGSVFAIPADVSAEALATEQARAPVHEISPSGPMFGYRMTEPTGEPGAMEAAVLKEFDLTPESFDAAGEKSKGGRRALRFFPKDLGMETGADNLGPFLQFSFSLPPGSFATVLLAEIMKTETEGE